MTRTCDTNTPVAVARAREPAETTTELVVGAVGIVVDVEVVVVVVTGAAITAEAKFQVVNDEDVSVTRYATAVVIPE